ncbi:MAG: hypothetical protein JWP92_2031 [Caulobacter sp.]|nr:hypothetical protein [Caulobacter sp.]
MVTMQPWGAFVVDRLFFLHNPKAGGTSVMSALRKLFDYQHQCPRIEDDAFEHAIHRGRYGAYRGYRFYGGHYGRDIYRAIGAGAPCVTNFRQPVERILSLYRYFRHSVDLDAAQLATPRYAAVRLAKTLSLDDFATCDEPAITLHTADHHFRQLTGSGWSPTVEGSLTDAIALIDTMPWFFVCETPQASMLWARRVFGGAIDTVPRLNETGATAQAAAADLGSRARTVLEERNQRDQTLYQHAVGLLFRATTPIARRA